MAAKSNTERAQEYADKIRAAVSRDNIALATGKVKVARDLRGGNLAATLQEIGQELDTLVYSDSNKPVPESEKEAIAGETARKLGFDRPLRIILKEASVQNFLSILSDIEALLQKVK